MVTIFCTMVVARPYDEVMDLNDVYSGDPVYLRVEDIVVPSRR